MERAKKIPFLCAFFLIVFVSTIRLSAGILIASADTIRKPTKRIGESFIEIGRKNAKIPRNLRFPQDFGQFSLSAKAKLLRNFQPLPLMSDFLYFSEKSLLSSFWEVLGVLGQVGLVGQVRDSIRLVRDSVERAAYRTGPTRRTLPSSNKASQESQVAAEHSPSLGRWRGLPLGLRKLLAQQKSTHVGGCF